MPGCRAASLATQQLCTQAVFFWTRDWGRILQCHAASSKPPAREQQAASCSQLRASTCSWLYPDVQPAPSIQWVAVDPSDTNQYAAAAVAQWPRFCRPLPGCEQKTGNEAGCMLLLPAAVVACKPGRWRPIRMRSKSCSELPPLRPSEVWIGGFSQPSQLSCRSLAWLGCCSSLAASIGTTVAPRLGPPTGRYSYSTLPTGRDTTLRTTCRSGSLPRSSILDPLVWSIS